MYCYHRKTDGSDWNIAIENPLKISTITVAMMQVEKVPEKARKEYQVVLSIILAQSAFTIRRL